MRPPAAVAPRPCCCYRVPPAVAPEARATNSAALLRRPRRSSVAASIITSAEAISPVAPSDRGSQSPVVRRFVLVRHGQSTWNAEGRIQGSSDVSVLTEKGKRQAREAAELLSRERFDALAHSPLARASETASIIWAGNEKAASGEKDGDGSSETAPPPAAAAAAAAALPSLREIDLHSFQGLLKSEGFSGRHAEAYARWKSDPEGFEIDGRFPVRDLWERAGAAWSELLQELEVSAAAAARPRRPPPPPSSPAAPPPPPPRLLVVAHNAVNQALVSSALGLPPRAFRRIVQSNGCVTELELELLPPLAPPPPPKAEEKGREGGRVSPPSPSYSPPAASGRVLRLNVGPRPPLKLPERGSGVALVVLVSLRGEGEGGEGEEEGEGEGGAAPPPRCPSLARALFGGGEGGGAGGSGLPADAPLVLADPRPSPSPSFSLAAAAEAAGFDGGAVERAAARLEEQRRRSSSPPSSPPSPPPLSFWRASAAAAAAAPLGVCIALGSREQVEGALRESLSDLLPVVEGEEATAPASPSRSSSPSSSFFSAPAGGVSVVEVDSAAVAAGVLAGTVRCANWRPAG